MPEDAIALATQTYRYEIGRDGRNRAFVDLASGRDYIEPDQPSLAVGSGGQSWPSTRVELQAGRLAVAFAEVGVQVHLRVESHRQYLLLTLEEVSGGDVDWVELCDLRLAIDQNVGTLVNAAWNGDFAACVLACTDHTHAFGKEPARAALAARCYREFGLTGARIAVLGVPTGGPDPAAPLLAAIETVELEQGLAHPTLDGVWLKRAPQRFDSYLMAVGASQANIDEVIAFARGGFGCVEIVNWWHSTPTYAPHPELFPDGMAGLRQVAEKVHAAGLGLGLHVMQGMVGWGGVGMKDPHVWPRADPRLLQDRRATLAAPADAATTEFSVAQSVALWPEQGDLFLEGELVRYGRRTEQGFAACERGLHGTTIAPHPAGTPVGLLVNCFPLWGHCIYAPDIHSTLIDEICDNIAAVFDATDCDMAYFDGGEEVAVQPPHWRHQGRIARGVMQRLRKPVILEGNALYTHHSWHVITRGSPSFDPIYCGRREYTLRFKGQNPATWARNLLTGDVGWFAPHGHSPSTDAVTPDEVMLLCLKALGGKAPISFQVHASQLHANERMPEMLQIIRACDELKRRAYFSEEVCTELTRPMAEHVLEQGPDGAWQVCPMGFGPSQTLNAGQATRRSLQQTNPYAAQTPWLRLRARTRLAPYGAPENRVLADAGEPVPFTAAASAATDLVMSVAPSGEKTPAGSSAFACRARNQGSARSGWCHVSLPLDPALDLSGHRCPGLWLHAEGKGGLLNLQLASPYSRRDHYIPLDFSGWAYFELDVPEVARFYDYTWPYSFTDLFYIPFRYQEVTGLDLYYNDLPPDSETVCLVGRIEALQEGALPLRSPALTVGDQELAFPACLQPDEYLELDWTGRCRHFGPNGGLVAEVQPSGRLLLGPGDSDVAFTCQLGTATTPRAEVTLAVKGDPLPNPRGCR